MFNARDVNEGKRNWPGEELMKKAMTTNARSSESGAVQIKTVLLLMLLAASVFVGIKVVPVYVEQHQVITDVDELARIAAIRGYNNDKIAKEIEKIREKYSLRADSITIASNEKGKVQIAVSYSVPIDLLITTYTWRVDYTATGKEL
jgi:Flp pilus assembly protein TadG